MSPQQHAPVRDAMIVAGGRGTRLQPLTHDCPKPLLDFCGAPFLAGVIGRLAAAGIERVFLIVGDDTAPFEVLRDDASSHGVDLVMVPEPEPLDTAGGVRIAAEQVEGTFLVLNGDILTDLDVLDLIAVHRDRAAAATLHLTPVPETSSFGVCVLTDGMVTAFVEKPPPGTLPGQHNINAGTYVLEPDVLRAFPIGRLSFERAVFPGILEAGGAIAGHVHEGVWADLGTPERWLDGHARALRGEVAWPSVRAVPERAVQVRVAGDAGVDSRATLHPPVLVLAGASIGAGAVLGPNVVVGQDVIVGEGVHLADSVLGRASRVGDGIRTTGLLLGPGAALGAQAKVGQDAVIGDGHVIEAGGEVLPGARVPTPRG